ncbi:MAG: tetratricopeptide repeat protein [Ignavibacteria bacterium]|jgi:tetratricopeptide (TPR) repeat protein|nr:tetratricopeptide repeat protein [Ignavibacteria bacterium]
MTKRLIILFLLFLPVINCYPQDRETVNMQILGYIYSCEFDSAEMKIKSLLNSNPKDPQANFFGVLANWWKINLDRRNVSLDEPFYQKVDGTLKVCEEILDDRPEDISAMLYKGAALGYRGLVKSLRESWISAADDGKQALNLMDKILEINPANTEASLGIGIYNYFADYVPTNYPFLKPLLILFPSGDKVKGLSQIKEASVKSRIAEMEANYILAFLNLSYERNFIESERYAFLLTQKYPDNPVFAKLLFNSYVGLGRYNEALTGYSGILEKSVNGLPGFKNDATLRESNYYIALSLLKLGRAAESEKYLNECMNLNDRLDKDDTSYKVFTVLMMGMKSDAAGNRDEAIIYYRRVLDMKEFSNSHREANNFLKTPYK